MRALLVVLGYRGRTNFRALVAQAQIGRGCVFLMTSVNPISAGFNLLGLGMHLLAAHDERVRIAKEENGACMQAQTALDGDLHTIFDAANAGLITSQEAMQACADVSGWYWQFITPFQQGPIRGNQCSSKFPANTKCYSAPGTPCAGRDCTAGCCLGCNVFDPSLASAYNVFKAGGGTAQICPTFNDKYGFVGRPGYSLTYKPSAIVKQAELTINAKTGIVSVGAPPSNQDAVIASGGISANSMSDQGGIASGINFNASGLGSNPLLILVFFAVFALLFGGLLFGRR